MTPKKAIEEIKWIMQNRAHNKELCNICIEALEKQISNSKRAPFDTESISCGNCNNDISDSDYSHCPYCGQKLDWSCLSDTETTFECDGKTYIVEFDESDEEE